MFFRQPPEYFFCIYSVLNPEEPRIVQVVRTGLCAEAAGDLLLHLGEPDAAFGLIIGERNRLIRGKAQNVGFIVSEPLKKASGFSFRLAATLALRCFSYGIGRKPFGDKSVITL